MEHISFGLYLPYDNDFGAERLEGLRDAKGRLMKRKNYGARILRQERKGSIPKNLTLMTMLDDGIPPIKLYTLTHQGMEVKNTKFHDSSNPEVLAYLLRRMKENGDIQALSIAGHGKNMGGNISLAFDADNLSQPDRQKWSSMTLKEASSKIHEVMDKPLDLLFLQICNGMTPESIKAVRKSSRFLLASQTFLGAPNTYYTGIADAARHIKKHSDEDPAIALARVIMLHEREALNLALVNPKAFSKLDLSELHKDVEALSARTRKKLIYFKRPGTTELADLGQVLKATGNTHVLKQIRELKVMPLFQAYAGTLYDNQFEKSREQSGIGIHLRS